MFQIVPFHQSSGKLSMSKNPLQCIDNILITLWSWHPRIQEKGLPCKRCNDFYCWECWDVDPREREQWKRRWHHSHAQLFCDDCWSAIRPMRSYERQANWIRHCLNKQTHWWPALEISRQAGSTKRNQAKLAPQFGSLSSKLSRAYLSSSSSAPTAIQNQPITSELQQHHFRTVYLFLITYICIYAMCVCIINIWKLICSDTMSTSPSSLSFSRPL